MAIGSFQIPLEVAVLGLITGLTYALLAVGLVLAYKSSRVLNFAQGEMGALAAAMVPILVISDHLPYWLSVVVALAVAAATGAFIHFVIILKFGRSSRLLAMVATIGASQLFFAVEAFLPKGRLADSVYPTPFHAQITVGRLHLDSADLLILAVVPVAVALLVLYLRRTRIGLAGRCAADNADAARLSGIPVNRVSLVIWVVTGLLAGAAGILVGPTRPLATTEPLGADLLVRILAAAMFAGLTSLPGAFAGGVAIGLVEAVLRWNYPNGGMLDLVLLALIVATLVAQPRLRAQLRGGEASSWSLGGTVRSLPPRLATHPRVRRARACAAVAGVAIALLLPFAADNAERVLMAAVALFAAMGVSLVVLTGWAGQLSFGQMAFVAVGALVGGRMYQLGYPTWMGVLYAVAAGAAVAFVIGIPALRIRGLFLAVVTMAFAVASQTWLFGQGWLVRVAGASTSLRIPRPDVLGIDVHSQLRFYWLSLAVLALLASVAVRVRKTGIGRTMMAVRDNEPAAAALGVSPRRAKLTAFVIAGAMAAFAGYFYGALLVNFPTSDPFSAELSLALVGMVIVGGVTTISGAILGAIYLKGLGYVLEPVLPSLLGSALAFFISGVGLLGAVLAFRDGGVVAVVLHLRDRLAERLARPPDTAPAAVVAPAVRLPPMQTVRPHPPADVLVAEDVTVRAGGHVIVDSVSIHAYDGEILGLIGPNGAGKTTLFDVLSGHLAPAAGRVMLFGEEVTGLRADERARRGLGRTFQQARLFDEMPLLDALRVAFERQERSEVVPSLLGLGPSRRAERAKSARARELLELLGLDRFAHLHTNELSTGMRRLAELGAVVALGARVVLLDEPTAGIAQREVEAFADVLHEVKRHLGATMVIVEHDMPLVSRLVDRLYVLDAGSVLAEGPPALLRDDPRVVAAYLGSDERMINRSGRIAASGGTRRARVAQR